jgi:hypothetical protein
VKVRALRWILAPFWALQIFSETKSFETNPILGSLRLNRRGLHVWRSRLARKLTEARRKKLEHLVSREDREAFGREGYLVKKDFAPPGLYRDLLAEIEAMSARAREFKEGDAITRRIALTPENLKKLPACRRLLELPEWRGLTRYVSSFDADPIIFVQSIFTQVDESRRDPQTTMHMDTFHPTMKAWLFLQEVALEDGPFNYVPGSHIRTPRREVWERRKSIEGSDPSIQRKGGAFRVTKTELRAMRCSKSVRLAVPGNTFVIADTSGFHARGRSERPSARIEIWAYSRKNPFIPWTGLDLASAPPVKHRQATIAWWFMDLRGKLGLKTPLWRDAGAVNPSEPPKPWLGEAGIAGGAPKG